MIKIYNQDILNTYRMLMNWFKEWFRKAIYVIKSPSEFYEHVDRKEDMSYSVKFAITSTIVFSIFGFIKELVMYGTSQIANITTIGIFILAYFAFYIMLGTVFTLVVRATIVQIFLNILGYKGINKTIEVMAYATSIYAFFGWIPYVTYLSLLYGLYVQIRGIEKFYSISFKKATIPFIAPLIITFGTWLALGLFTPLVEIEAITNPVYLLRRLIYFSF